MKDSAKISRRILIFWCLFIGMGAVFGSTCMFIEPSGTILKMDTLLPYFQVLPFADVLFQDYIFSGIALLLVNGVSNLLSAVLMLKKKRVGINLGTIFGFTLILWICIQFCIFETNVLDISYFTFGVLQLLTGIVCLIRTEQDNYVVDENAYKNVGKEHKTLVVYFSREGYSKRLAYEYADKLGCDIEEIKATEKTQGTLGFWWCGRFGMMNMLMPTLNVASDISTYDKVIIVSPVWVFGIAAPVKDFMDKNKNAIRSYELTLTHFTNIPYNYLVEDAKNRLGKAPIVTTSVTICWGKRIRIRTL